MIKTEQKYTNQFLPEKFNIILKDDIKYNNKIIKKDYLIDIVHNMLISYYFKKINSYVLNSLVLKDKYGHYYNYYIGYLVENNIIILENDYIVGVKSRIYSLEESILNSKIIRYKNYNKTLIKKQNHKCVNSYESNNIDINIKNKLIDDIYHIKIDYERSIYFLNSVKNDDKIVYERNLHSVESIRDGDLFYTFDMYGRFHSNFTILKSFIRKNCLLLDNEETCEIDIANSQPLFLSILIDNLKSNWVSSSELLLFKTLTASGNFYQYLIDNLNLNDKKEAKNITYKIFFGKNHFNSKLDKKFISLFPTIHNFIKLYKKEKGDYRSLSHKLQLMESDLIFNHIIKKIHMLYPHIKIITVHDSIIINKEYKDIVNSIFQSELNKIKN